MTAVERIRRCGTAVVSAGRHTAALRVSPFAPGGRGAWARSPRPRGTPRRTHMARPSARCGLGESEARRGGSGGPMQDAENVAAPEAAEERAEPEQQQPAAEPPQEEPPRPAGPGAQEAADGEDEESEAGPGPEVPAEPAANGEEEAGATPGPSPPPPEELPAPAADGAPGEQARDAAAEGRSDGAGGELGAAENGDADEPSFSDPEDFVDDVSEEGEAAGSRRTWAGVSEGWPPFSVSSPAQRQGLRGDSGPLLPSRERGRMEVTWRPSRSYPSQVCGGRGATRRARRSLVTVRWGGEGRAEQDTARAARPPVTVVSGRCGCPRVQPHLSKGKQTRGGLLGAGAGRCPSERAVADFPAERSAPWDSAGRQCRACSPTPAWACVCDREGRPPSCRR